ncbi:uncharacterized protein BYT42DRAFT_610333 [Radiomyces spectabilis]|uniref:uncharacterized protein n=1 Tax=Radiomyces spectabilis TaxID=64574 RepID=UPI00221FF347|nr:uncharacterized protein BYT42DRAFT_610333 [Radiomyces spectabilis]KAI8391073.1 hypothetical protein BYT42DRAFT_610333 [Radiomyces spectabilis]
MTPVDQPHPSLTTATAVPNTPGTTIIDTGDKKARLPSSYSTDMYAAYPSPASGQIMINGDYSPVNTPNGYGLYSAANASYTNMAQYNGSPQTVMNLPTPQFVNGNLGSPSPSIGSTFSAHQSGFTHPLSSPQLPSAAHQTARTVYLGNVPSDVHVSEILDHVKSGVIESVRPLPEKNCVFITFAEATAATHFYHEASSKRLTVNGVDLKVGWGKASAVPVNLQLAMQNGAMRNVFLGSLDDSFTESMIRQNLSRFGHIEHVRLIRERNIAFVHFLSVANAVKCVNTLPTESLWQGRRINYGKDRCAPAASKVLPHGPVQHVYHPSANYPNSAYSLRYPTITYDPYTGAAIETYHPAAVQTTNGSPVYHTNATMLSGLANRTIYLGNIHPDTTCEEICNVIRGGILSQIRYMPDKHIAFVAFVDPALALHFYNQAVYHGLVIKNRRLKVGWGKPSTLPAAVITAVQNGGSRNVYLGNIDDTITEEKLKQDFSEYGEIELVNTLKEKNCAFVNFTGIAAAVRAIEGIRSKEEYKKFRINYGKDRCGNAPRMSHKTALSVQEPGVGGSPEDDLSHPDDCFPTVNDNPAVTNGILLDSVLAPNE